MLSSGSPGNTVASCENNDSTSFGVDSACCAAFWRNLFHSGPRTRGPEGSSEWFCSTKTDSGTYAENCSSGLISTCMAARPGSRNSTSTSKNPSTGRGDTPLTSPITSAMDTWIDLRASKSSVRWGLNEKNRNDSGSD